MKKKTMKEIAAELDPCESMTVVNNGKTTLLCGTVLVFEDNVWNHAKNIVNDFAKDTRITVDEDNETFIASRIRDAAIKIIEKELNIKIVIGHDSF